MRAMYIDSGQQNCQYMVKFKTKALGLVTGLALFPQKTLNACLCVTAIMERERQRSFIRFVLHHIREAFISTLYLYHNKQIAIFLCFNMIQNKAEQKYIHKKKIEGRYIDIVSIVCFDIDVDMC